MENLFSNSITNQDAAIERLRQQFLPDLVDDPQKLRFVDNCICETVEDLWESRVKVFVPVLANRQVRLCLERGTCAEEKRD